MSDNKIKIFYVTCALNVGGAEKFLLDLLKHLDKRKFASQVATVIGGGTLEPEFRALGIPLHIYGRRRLRYLGGVVQLFQLFFLFRRERPQIVHTQLFAADLWGRIAAWLAGVPVIITTEQNVNVDQSWLRELLKKWTYHLADRVAAISTAVKKYAIKHYDVPEKRIEVIPNDVDVEEFERRISQRCSPYQGEPEGVFQKDGPHLSFPCRGGNEKKIILTIGRLVEQKGQKYLIEAFSKLKEKEKYELWIAGEGPLRQSLEKLAEKLNISQPVKFLGNRSDVPALLAQADLFVFPSLWEGLGIAVLEAAIAKVPIVATAVDGVLDIIKDGETGRLVKPGDSAALGQAMEEALANPEQAKEKVEKAYQFVKGNFDVKAVVKKYEKMYLDVIASPDLIGINSAKQSRPI